MTRRFAVWLIAALSILALGGCFDRAVTQFPVRPMMDFTAVRAEAGHEWRDARRIGGGAPVAVDLGAAIPRGAVRVGFFDAAEDRNRGTIRVYAGDRRIADWKLDGRGVWRDERVELADMAGESLRLVVDTVEPVPIAPCEIVPPQTDDAPANVLVFLIDTLRQDRMSTYGHARETSPVISELAAESTVFTHLTPSSSWTRPSVASLFTSQHPNYHGAQTARDKLRKDLPSLAAALSERGYETQGLMTNANCLPVWGFGGDFARYVDVDTLFKDRERNDKPVTDAAIAAIEHLRGRPWFLHVHAMGPHTPYDPPEPFRSQFATDLTGLEGDALEVQQKLDLYDAEIAFTDYQFGRIVAALKETGQYDNTLIVVLSDHGEEFLDHGKWEHAKTLYEEMLRVPLIVKPPKGAWAVPGRVEAVVEMIDVAPTLLEIIGVSIPARFQGRSFLPLIRGEAEPPRTAYASLNQEWYSLRAAKTRARKYIRDVVQNTDVWFDLAADPLERNALTESADWGEALRDLVTARSLGGSNGLHVLVVAEDAPVEGVIIIQATDLGEANTSGSEWTTELVADTNLLRWNLSGAKSYRLEISDPDRVPRQAAERVHAHLSVPVPLATQLELDVRFDGAPIDPVRVHLGHERKSGSLNQTVLNPVDLLAHPDGFDLAGLPRAFGVYIWYVAPAESLADDDVPLEVREALEALGYVNN